MVDFPAEKNILQTKQQKEETYVLPILWKLIPTIKITRTEDKNFIGHKLDVDIH